MDHQVELYRTFKKTWKLSQGSTQELQIMYGNTYYWPNLSQGLRARASTCSSSSNLFFEKGISDVLQQTRQRKNGGFPAETRIFEKNGAESRSERNFPPKFLNVKL